MVFDDLSDLPVVLPILRKGPEHSRLWAPVTPRAGACPEATVRAAILHAHDDTRAARLYIAGVSSKASVAPLQNPAVANSLQAASRRYQLSTTTTVRITHRTHASSFRTSNFLSPTERRPKPRGCPGRPLPPCAYHPHRTHRGPACPSGGPCPLHIRDSRPPHPATTTPLSPPLL